MATQTDVLTLLRTSGAQLKRQKRHEVWVLPSGCNFVRSKTPSDRYVYINQLSLLRRLLRGAHV